MTSSASSHLLFVCTGNTCRSPMAECLARHLTRSVPGWEFHSAGLFARPGSPASPEAIEAIRERDLDLTPHRSRLVEGPLLEEMDWIVPMTTGHAQVLLESFPLQPERVQTLTSFSPEGGGGDVLDPFGGSLETYRRVRDQIESALSDLILAVIHPAG